MADPLASLRQWGVEVTIRGQDYLIPPRPAVDWFETMLTDNLLELLPPEAQEQVEELYDENPEAVNQIALDAYEAASGRPWYVAARLVSIMLDTQARGEILARVDLDRLSFAGALDAIYATFVRWMDKDKRAEFDAMLNAPTPGRPGGIADPREQARRMREMSGERGATTGKPSAASPPRTPQPRRPHRLAGTPARPRRPQ